MSCENTTVTRSNFASRLLNKAMSERTKTGEVAKPTANAQPADAPIVESKETAAASK